MFRGASADARAALGDELGTVVSGSPDSAAKVGGDLFGVAATLRGEGALRRFLTDASLAEEARTGLVGQLFGGKIDDGALTVLTSAVRRRWVANRDLGDALEELAVVAVVRSTGADAGRLADELFAFAQAVKQDPALRDALSDPARADADKRALLHTLLDGRALPATIALAEQSLSTAHRTVGVALEDYQKIAAEAQGEGVATVRVAHELTEGDERRLGEVLSRQYGRQIHINQLIDPSVLGGIRVEIGDDVIDGTVSARLDSARRSLAG